MTAATQATDPTWWRTGQSCGPASLRPSTCGRASSSSGRVQAGFAVRREPVSAQWSRPFEAPVPEPVVQASPTPGSIGNKVVTDSLRDGTLLCPDFNMGRCAKGDRCTLPHRCAVMRRSGRVCGGHQPAQSCRECKILGSGSGAKADGTWSWRHTWKGQWSPSARLHPHFRACHSRLNDRPMLGANHLKGGHAVR